MGKKVVDKGWKITGATECILIEVEYAMGGHNETVFVGDIVHIETKFGNSYTGQITGFVRAEKEGEQDGFTMWCQNEKNYKVGIHDIAYMEIARNGWMD